MDAYAAQLALIYTPEPGLKLAPVQFEQMTDSIWSSKSGWNVSLEQRDGKEFWALHQITDTGDLWSLYATREEAMAIAEEMQYPGPDEGPDDITLVWSQNSAERALEQWISPDGTAWHLHYGRR